MKDFQIEIESRLHCIDIFDDDCMLKYIEVTAVRSRKMAKFSDNKELESNYFYLLMTLLHSKVLMQGKFIAVPYTLLVHIETSSLWGEFINKSRRISVRLVSEEVKSIKF